MNYSRDMKSLYENQYGAKKLHREHTTFKRARKWFRKYDTSREDVVVGLLDSGEKLLDVGCGSASLLCRAAERFKSLYGLDLSPSRIEEARKTLPEALAARMNLYEHDIGRGTSFADGTFDAVTCVAVIEHVFDPYSVTDEINRIIRMGGIYISQVPNIAYLRQRIRLLFGILPVTSSPYNWREIGWDGGHLHYFTRKTYCGLLEDCGFEILKVTGSGFFADFRNFYPQLLTGDIVVKARKVRNV